MLRNLQNLQIDSVTVAIIGALVAHVAAFTMVLY